MRWLLPVVMLASASCGAFGASDDAPVPPGTVDAAVPPPPDGAAPMIDGSDGSDASVDAKDAAAPGKTYLGCSDAQVHGVTTDGDVLVDVDGVGALPPFTVRCTQMAGGGEPDAYLPLVQVTDPNAPDAFANGKNISGWRSGGTCDCPPDVVRAYTKVRILLDHSPIELYLDDTTFSMTNRGSLGCESGNPACEAFATPAHNYGVASGCASTPGRGNVDLTGTPFRVKANESGLSNGGTTGTTVYTQDRKGVEVTSGADCGHQFPGRLSNFLDIEFQ